MLIERDITPLLDKKGGLYAQIVIGPRQCGKRSVLSEKGFSEVSLDDMQIRLTAEKDPALFFAQHSPPLLIDEVQYAPALFPQIKLLIDKLKRERLKTAEPPKMLFRLTGSNQILMDKTVKETLVGRASYYQMNTLSVHELKRAFPKIDLKQILFQGGWPELYVNTLLNPVRYLNDYILSYVEKDIVMSAGITKRKEFHTVLGMLAARTGNILNNSSLAKDSGVQSVTVREWVSVLERSHLLYLLMPISRNLNKRLIKAPKVYFLDTGLACRLQGWQDASPLLQSPQAGALFETLVLAEIVKCMINFGKTWKLGFFRTKSGEEVDFIIENERSQVLAIDAKLAIHSASPLPLPSTLKKIYPQLTQTTVVTYQGKRMPLSQDSLQIPLSELTDFLLDWDR